MASFTTSSVPIYSAVWYILQCIPSTVPIIIIAVLLIILGLILNFTYTNIFKLILFDYINGKGLPDGLDENLINSSIRRKGGTGGFGNMPF